MKIVNSRWLFCPVCGDRIMRAKKGALDYPCSCGVKLTACISNEFVTTMINSNESKEEDIREKLDSYYKTMQSMILH